MRDGARIQAAIDILERIKNSRVPMDTTIRDYMHSRRYIGAKDRRFIVDLAYDCVRATARLGWLIDKYKLSDTPRSRVMTYLATHDYSFYDIDIRFVDEQYCPAPLTEEEKEALRAMQEQGQAINDPAMSDTVRAECPAWAEDKLRPVFKENFEEEMVAMLLPAPLDLRVNTVKIEVERAQDSLAKDDVKTKLTPYSPEGLRCFDKPYLSATKAFHKGFIEIQDEGSQLIAYVCGAQPGMRILDFCAGGGGKTLALAARMEGKGIIFAMDNDTQRLDKGRVRYKKAGIHNVEVRSLEEDKNRKWLRRQKDAMDIVLVDAPCSSSGTWRRNPDLRWQTYGPELETIKQAQADILERVADKVKIGGRLVYATCSLFREENEEQVARFLQVHPEYKIMPIPQIWPSAKPCPVTGDFLRLTPKQHETDGFFAAVLQRIS